MNQTIPPPPKGYRVITEDERKALCETGKVMAEAQFYHPKTDQWICGGCSFLSTTCTYAIRYDEWIPWAGNAYCPLPVGTKVDVRLRNGNEETANVEAGSNCNMTYSGFWARDNSNFAVTAYRVHEPEQVVVTPEDLKAKLTGWELPSDIEIKYNNSGWYYAPPNEAEMRTTIPKITITSASANDDSLLGDYYITTHTQPKQQTNENTMNTQSETPVGSVGIPIYSNNYYPEIRSTWVYRHPNHDTLRGIVVAADHETIAIKHDGSNGHCLYTTSEWNSFPKTRFYTKKELKQMAKQNRPGNIIVKTGGSRKRWFLIGAAAMYVGKPFIPAATYHVMQFINSIL